MLRRMLELPRRQKASTYGTMGMGISTVLCNVHPPLASTRWGWAGVHLVSQPTGYTSSSRGGTSRTRLRPVQEAYFSELVSCSLGPACLNGKRWDRDMIPDTGTGS